MGNSISINGFCDEKFLPVKEAFGENFAEGLEWGASLCVTHKGENVLDLWAGVRDPSANRPWREDTLTNVASTTKIITTLCALIQVDRGLLDLDETVASYWPEFGDAGKENITLRHVLTHRAGIPGLKSPASNRTLNNWSEVIELIEKESPWFEPGTIACYHAFHYGFILGELIRRTSGKKPAEFFHEEVANRIGADFSIGWRGDTPFRRRSVLVFNRELPFEEGSIEAKVMGSYALDPQEPCWDSLSREDPSGNGWGNGRSIARVCAVLANGGQLDGIRLLSRETIEEAAKTQYYGDDLLMGPIRWGLGFGLHSDEFPAPTRTTFQWGGIGGSWGLMDLSCAISAGYAMNRGIIPSASELSTDVYRDPRMARIWDALGPIMMDLQEN